MTTPFLHTSWSALLQVFLNLGLLVYYIGWSALTGFALLIITIPTQVQPPPSASLAPALGLPSSRPWPP